MPIFVLFIDAVPLDLSLLFPHLVKPVAKMHLKIRTPVTATMGSKTVYPIGVTPRKPQPSSSGSLSDSGRLRSP